MGKKVQRSLAASSREVKGADKTSTPAMTEALRISWMEICNMSQSSPSSSSVIKRKKFRLNSKTQFELCHCSFDLVNA